MAEVQKSDNPLDDVFTEFLQSPRVFKNRDVLTDRYIPDKLPHRTTQIKALGYTLASILRGARPSNVFLYGKTGTGKTAVAKFVLKNLAAKAKEQGYDMSTAYINCHTVDTNYRVFAELCHFLDVKVPFTGLPTDEVFNRFCTALDEKNTLFVIVMDEIDLLVKKSGSETLYQLTRINTVLEKSRVSIVGISNDLKFKEYLDPRVLSSLSEEEIVFRPYTAQELNDILNDRAHMAFNDGCIDDAVIPLIAAIAAREHGDARRAIDLLRVAGEITERNGDSIITPKHVRMAHDAIERNTVSEVVTTLPIQSKLLLTAIYLQYREREKNDETGVTTGDAYQQYIELCDYMRMEPLTQRRISELINELDLLGIISARVVSRGRYGRTKQITFTVSTRLVHDALSSDMGLKKFLNFS